MAELVPLAQKQSSVRDLLTKMLPQMAMASTKHLNPERLMRVTLTCMQRTPTLFDCTQHSLAGAVMTCSQLGLEPDPITGQAYLIPFRNGRNGTTECQLIIGYKGLVTLARNSGQVSTIQAVAVHEKDCFSYELGLEPTIKHKPSEEANPGEMTHVYAVCRLKDGGVQFEVMNKAQVDAIRSKSRAGNSGPWVDHHEEMAKKTVLRRLCKLLPMSVEMHAAVALDDAVETGRPQDFSEFVDVSFAVESTDEETAADDA